MKRANLTIKTLMMAGLSLAVVGGMTSCKKEGCTDSTATNYDEKAKKDDGSCVAATPVVSAPTQGAETKTGKISADETWTSNNIYTLNGKVVVEDGVTLTIEAGTIIKGAEGQESAASALVVAQGGKLMAEGTAENPIIFTSTLDNITYDQKVGTNLKKTNNELWGGIVICGKAKVSTENGDAEGNIEGINPSDGFGKYGGANDADNSGSLAYVSIRHGGISIGEGNELNALTLGGVGNGTKISNIEVYATLDDGIECFGGSVDITDALVFYQGDDGLDLDQNYSGTISGFAVIHGDGIGTDEALEVDGPEGSTHSSGKFTITNGICKSEGIEGTPGDFKSGAQGNVTNVTFMYSSATKKAIKFRTKFVAPGTDCTHKGDAYKNLIDGMLVFAGVKTDVDASVYDGDKPDTPVCVTELDAAQLSGKGKVTINGAGSSYDYKTKFSWGAAANNGELN